MGPDQISERRVCRVLEQPRGTQRYRAKVKDDERTIIKRMHALVRRHPRRGYRFVHAMLRDEGFHVNRKRIYRLWKKEGFKVPQKQRKSDRWALAPTALCDVVRSTRTMCGAGTSCMIAMKVVGL